MLWAKCNKSRPAEEKHRWVPMIQEHPPKAAQFCTNWKGTVLNFLFAESKQEMKGQKLSGKREIVVSEASACRQTLLCNRAITSAFCRLKCDRKLRRMTVRCICSTQQHLHLTRPRVYSQAFRPRRLPKEFAEWCRGTTVGCAAARMAEMQLRERVGSVCVITLTASRGGRRSFNTWKRCEPLKTNMFLKIIQV